MTNEISAALVEFALSRNLNFPTEAYQTISLSLLDWAAVGLAGVDEPVSNLAKSHIGAEVAGVGASVFASSVRHSARDSAFANGTISHALDYDDTHFAHIGHLSTVVISSVLALCEEADLSVAELQEASIVGFECACRIGIWLGRTHYKIGFHQTATAGALGATLGCARALRLDHEMALNALGLATSRASGLKSQFGTMGKPMNAGFAAATAVESVQLGKLGATSCSAPLSGQNRFGDTHHGEGNSELALKDISSRYVMTDNKYKFHACCHGLHAMLEALGGLERSSNPADIRSIEVRTNPQWMSVCNKPSPTTGLEAKFSYRMTAALAVLGYDTGKLEVYNNRLCQGIAVKSLMDRTTVVSDETVPELSSMVDVTFEDETKQKLTADLMAPVEFEVLKVRLQKKAEGLIGVDKAKEIWSICEMDSEATSRQFAACIAGL